MCLIIVGGGKFGIKAIEYAKEKNQTAILVDMDVLCQAIKFTDKNFNSFKEFKKENTLLYKNTIYFIKDNVKIINEILNFINIDYIIPVIPIHLMASIISTFLYKNSINLIPDIESINNFTKKCDKNLILSINITQAIVYMSHAKSDELCPDNCAGLPNYCPHFKRVKNVTITHYLRKYYNINKYIDIKEEDTIKIIIIIESYQLKPGLGGLKGLEITNILKFLEQKLPLINHRNCKIMIATTCNCHGVINFFQKEEKKIIDN